MYIFPKDTQTRPSGDPVRHFVEANVMVGLDDNCECPPEPGGAGQSERVTAFSCVRGLWGERPDLLFR